MQVYLDSLLNWAWAGLSLAAFAWFACANRPRGIRVRRATASRAIALSLALVSLFPCISASDDAARLALWSSETGPDSGSGLAAGSPQRSDETLATLVRLLEMLEASQTAASVLIAVALFLVGYTIARPQSISERLLPSSGGRGPPVVVVL